MKTLITLFFSICFLNSLTAQELIDDASLKSISVGVVGGLNSTWLFNKNISDAGDNINMTPTFGGYGGINSIYEWNRKYGISLSLIFSGHNQIYNGEVNNNAFSYTNKIRLTYLDIPLLFRMKSLRGPYFELGPQVSFLLSALENYHSDPEDKGLNNYTDKDVKSDFKNTNIAVIVGFGIDFDFNEIIFLTGGLRFGYGLTDITEEYSFTEVNSNLGANSMSFTSIFSHLDRDANFNYEPNRRVFGGLIIGVSYLLD